MNKQGHPKAIYFLSTVMMYGLLIFSQPAATSATHTISAKDKNFILPPCPKFVRENFGFIMQFEMSRFFSDKIWTLFDFYT